jgi:multiple sugar transport system substrate-binding protein
MLISVTQQIQAPPYDVDVLIIPWPDWISRNSPYLNSVTDLVVQSQFPANIISPVKSGDTVWAAPFKLSGKPGFWYRPSFFQANGLSVPTTYDEFKNTLLPAIAAVPGVEQAIASGVDAQGLGWPLSDTTEAFIIGLGGYQLQLDLITGPSVRNWTDPQVESVFTDLTDLLAAGYFSPPAEWESQLAKLWNGQYGIYFQGSFVTTLPEVENTSDFAFFSFPATNGVSGSIDYAVITKDAPHLDQAKQLVQYLATANAQEILVKQGGALATNTGVPASDYTTVDASVVQFMGSPGITIVPDLDDTIGGQWQTTFWDQLKLLWATPNAETMNSVLNNLQTAAIEQQGT